MAAHRSEVGGVRWDNPEGPVYSLFKDEKKCEGKAF